MRKILSFALICILLLCSMLSLSACNEQKKEEAPKPLMLFLGDSIAEAVAGPTPLTERESYGYYGIIGNINNYEYYNRGVSGSTTANLLRYVYKEDDGLNMVKTLISTADIIHISILGNDLLNTSHKQLLINAANGNYSFAYEKKESAKKNIEKTIERIRTLNPDVTLIIQTLYNPVGDDSPLTAPARATLDARGYTTKDYHERLSELVTIMNSALYEYLDEHTVTAADGTVQRPFELIDVYGAIEEVYTNDFARYNTLFCEDGIHPSNEAHAIMAELIQDKLTELKLQNDLSLVHYKNIRVEQLNRLYEGKIDTVSTRAAIRTATSMREVSRAYFDATRNIPADAKLMLDYKGNHFSQKKTYRFSTMTVMGSPFVSCIDQQKSYVTFYEDGRVEARMTIDDLTMAMIKFAIESVAPMNLSDDYRLYLIYPYWHNLFPQVDVRDFMSILSCFEQGYGITFEGIDYECETSQYAINNFRETLKFILKDSTFFDGNLSIIYRGQYKLGTMTNRLTGETLTGIYLNGALDNSESYVRFAYTETNSGSTIRLLIDVAETVIEGTEDLVNK